MSDETVYLVAKDYSAACVYAGEHETALRFWSHALTSSRNSPKAADAIPADNASEYDATPAHRKLAEEFIGFVRQNLANGDNFIDLCCGTGLNAEFLDRPDSRTIGIDLELGGLKAAGRIHYFHELLEGSIEDMLPTLPAAHFDAIWCCGALYFFTTSGRSSHRQRDCSSPMGYSRSTPGPAIPKTTFASLVAVRPATATARPTWKAAQATTAFP